MPSPECQLSVPINTWYLEHHLAGSEKHSLPGETQLPHSLKNQKNATETIELNIHSQQREDQVTASKIRTKPNPNP